MDALAPVFALGLAEKAAAFVIKCLAVGGGFLAGTALGWVVAQALDRWAFGRKSPEVVKRAVKLVTGAVVAVLVAILVFGDGGGGGLFGGSGGDATGKGAGPDATDPGKAEKTPVPTPPPDPKAPQPKVEPVKTPDLKPTDVPIRVTFLGGADVVGDRYYLLDDEPKTFEELKAAVLKRKEESPQKVYLHLQFTARNQIAADSLNVTQVTDWAKNAGIDWLNTGKR